jgi:hypothetical protein
LPKPGPFDEIEESALLEELFELAHAVAAVLLIIEVDEVPSSGLPVQSVESPGFRILRHQQELQD